MGYTVFVTEKPSVAQYYKNALRVREAGNRKGYIEGYSSVLDKNVRITWAVGHLVAIGSPDEQKQQCALPDGHKEERWRKEELPLLPETFFFRPNTNTLAQYNVIKHLYLQKDVDAIYYAGDSGREGIYIQALIRNQIFAGRTPGVEERVVWIDSYTDETILNGIYTAKPYQEYRHMIDSGYKRAISDWLIGMNFTRALTLSCGGLLTVGRVQTPTLAMVVERQQEIDSFKVEDFYGISAAVEGIASPVRWRAVKSSRYYESPLLFNEHGFRKKEDVMQLLSGLNRKKELTVADVRVTEKREYAPLLFNLTELQAYCAKHLFLSPAETLAVAQSLYEKKLTTYPRTDARVLSSAVAADLNKKLGVQIPRRYVDDDRITDHYAIIPTFLKADSLTGNEKQIYDAVYNRFRAILMPPYVYDAIALVWQHENGECFFANDRRVKQTGWKELYACGEENRPAGTVPERGASYPAEFGIHEMETSPPAVYTTGTLTLAMEKAGKLIEDEVLREQIKTCGIGTPATRAGILENLNRRGYITVDKKQRVHPTERGKELVAIVKKVDATLASPEKTADMEQKLQDIAEGKVSAASYQEYIEQYVKKTTDAACSLTGCRISPGSTAAAGGDGRQYCCPFCGTPLKSGPYGYFCPAKDFSLGTVAGCKMSSSDLDSLLSKGKTRVHNFTAKSGKKFKARLVLDSSEKKTVFEFA